MNKALFRLTGMLALAFLAATQIARAQEPMLVNIPFEFTAGQMTLPAGEYRVQKAIQGSSVLLIQRADRSAQALAPSFAAETNERQAKSKLVFHRYGDRYFLSQVWIAGSSRGRELPKSAKEKEQALAGRNQTPDQVTIIARLTPSKP
jgi:hypothetical protein